MLVSLFVYILCLAIIEYSIDMALYSGLLLTGHSGILPALCFDIIVTSYIIWMLLLH